MNSFEFARRTEASMSLRPNYSSKKEFEIRILSTPLVHFDSNAAQGQHDYEAPQTAENLRPTSKWIIVRNNLHKIRSWGTRRLSNVDKNKQDWYILFQMRRELRRAQLDIDTIPTREGYRPLKYFFLPKTSEKVQRYNVSHVRPDQFIYYPVCSSQPFRLQSLLYYFTKDCYVPHNSVFQSFLNEICSIVYRDRQRLKRTNTLRRYALILAVCIGFLLCSMFIALIVSLFTTANQFRTFVPDEIDRNLDFETSTFHNSF